MKNFATKTEFKPAPVPSTRRPVFSAVSLKWNPDLPDEPGPAICHCVSDMKPTLYLPVTKV